MRKYDLWNCSHLIYHSHSPQVFICLESQTVGIRVIDMQLKPYNWSGFESYPGTRLWRLRLSKRLPIFSGLNLQFYFLFGFVYKKRGYNSSAKRWCENILQRYIKSRLKLKRSSWMVEVPRFTFCLPEHASARYFHNYRFVDRNPHFLTVDRCPARIKRSIYLTTIFYQWWNCVFGTFRFTNLIRLFWNSWMLKFDQLSIK